MRQRIFAAILATLLTSQVTAHVQTRAVTLNDLINLETQPNLAIRLSGDATLLAAGLSGRVRIVDTRSKKLLFDLGPGFSPEWSPDARHLAFYSARSGDMQLWLWERASGRQRQLTKFFGGIDPNPTTRVFGRIRDAFQMSWSPDGTRIVFASRASRTVPVDDGREQGTPDSWSAGLPLVLTTSTPPEWTMMGVYAHAKYGSGTAESRDGVSLTYRAGPDGFGQLFVVQIATGQLTQVTSGEATRFQPAWSPWDDVLVYVEVTTQALEYDTRRTQIMTLDLASGETRSLSSEASVKSFPQWSPDGSRIAYISGARVDGERRVLVTKRMGGEPAPAFALDRRISQFAWSTHGDSFLTVYKDGPSTPLARIASGAREVQLISSDNSGALDVGTFTQSRTGAVAWVQEDAAHLWSVQYLRRGAARPETLLRAPGADQLRLGKVEILQWRDRGGESKQGTLLLPPDATTGKKYPLIVDVYTTRSGADWIQPIGGNQAWASMGYAAFRPSPRAPHASMNPWTTEASSRAAAGPAGWDVTFDDVMSGIEAADQRGAVDTDRMCLFGHSNGGNVATELLTRTARFRCAVIVAPAASNLLRLFLAGGWNPSSLNDDNPLEDHVDDYIALSPVFRLHRVQTPVLLAAGDNDGDFLLNTIEIYNRLRAQSKPVTLLRYPNQGHLFNGDALQDFWSREMAFFEQHLQPR